MSLLPFLAWAGAVATLAACGGGEMATPGVPVPDGMPPPALATVIDLGRQCEPLPTGPQSALRLVSQGVDVLQTRCLITLELNWPLACGAWSLHVIEHDIRPESLPFSSTAGFRDKRSFPGDFFLPAVPYDCATWLPLP